MKKKLLLISLIAALFLQSNLALAVSNIEEGVRQLADHVSKNMMDNRKQKIAIVDFSDLNGNITALGQFLAEELTTQLFIIASGKFEVVERRQLQKLEEELILGQIGFIEEKSIKKMGQILGVDAILTGSITDLGNTVKVNARLIGVESARVFAVAATDIPKTEMVANLMTKQMEKKGSIAKPQSPTASTVQQQIGKQESPFFQNEIIRITVKSLKKTGNAIKLILSYENITEKDIQLRLYGEVSLTDENGERWEFEEADGILLSNIVGHTDFPPKLPKIVKLAFSSRGNTNGKVFTIVLNHYHYGSQKFHALISDIKAE